MTKPIPDGFRTLTPHVVVHDGEAAIDFYVETFGAEEIRRMLGHAGKIMYAELKIGDCVLLLADEIPPSNARSARTIGDTPVALRLYVDDVEGVFERAVQSGATIVSKPHGTFWGDRVAEIVDPFGHSWTIATHVEDLSPEEISARAAAELFPHDD